MTDTEKHISRYDPRCAYMNDPLYRRMVDTIKSVLHDHQMTPGEVRSAAVLACAMYEAENTSPRMYYVSVEQLG